MISVTDCYFSGSLTGIKIDDTQTGEEGGIFIDGGTAVGGSSLAVDVQGSSRARISGMLMVSGENGVWLGADDGAVLVNCTIFCDKTAIIVDTDNAIVRGNRCYPGAAANNTYDGIAVWGAGALVEHNYVHANPGGNEARYAIAITGDDNVIVGNHLMVHGTGPINTAGSSGTILVYPSNTTYGDNFTGDPPGGGGGVDELAELIDVDLAGLADGDFLVWDSGAGEWVPVTVSPGTDANAIHDNVAAEISALTEVTPATGDWLVVEDVSDSDNKKKVQVGNLPSGSATVIAEGRLDDGGSLFALVKPGCTFNSTPSTGTIPADVVKYEPFLTQTEIEVTEIRLNVTAGNLAGRLLRVGIYEADYDWMPGALVVDAGDVDCTAAGVKTVSVSETLPAGRYLAAMNSNNASLTCRYVRSGSLMGVDPALATGLHIFGFTAPDSYGALPDPGTAWDSLLTSTDGFAHRMFLRLATPA